MGMDQYAASEHAALAARPVSTVPLSLVSVMTLIGGVTEIMQGRWMWALAALAGTAAWSSLALEHARAGITLVSDLMEGPMIAYRTAADRGEVAANDVIRIIRARSTRFSDDVGLVTGPGHVITVAKSLTHGQATRLVDALEQIIRASAAEDQGLVGAPAPA